MFFRPEEVHTRSTKRPGIGVTSDRAAAMGTNRHDPATGAWFNVRAVAANCYVVSMKRLIGPKHDRFALNTRVCKRHG